MKNGKGKYTFAASNPISSYEGEWKDGNSEGIGRLQFKDGRIFDGEFKNGQMNGAGIMRSGNGAIIEQGKWKDDLFIGQ